MSDLHKHTNFVHQENRRVVDERAGKRHALLLSTGQLGQAALAQLGQAEQVEGFLQSPAHRDRLDTQGLHPVGQFVLDGVGDECGHRILDHEAHAIDGHAEIDPAALDVLLRHDWPGNIRELRNALCYALSIADGEPITIQDLPSDVLETRNARDTGDIDETHNTHNTRDTGDTSDGRWTAEEWERHDGGRRAPPAGRHDRALPIAPGGAERDALLAVLRRHHWNVSAAARNLGTCRATVYRRMKRLDIVSPTRSD